MIVRPSGIARWGCPGGAAAARVRALLLAGALLCGTCGLARGEEPAWLPAAVQTRDGSKFIGLLQGVRPLAFRGDTPAAEALDWRSIHSLTLADRPAPEALSQAEQAVRELASDDYQTRARALAKLRELGRSAGAALREASTSTDAEVSTRGKELLAELGPGAAEVPADRVTLSDGRELAGQALAEVFLLQTRWGLLRIPSSSVQSLTRLERLPAEMQLAPPPPEAQALEVRAAVPSRLVPRDRDPAKALVVLRSGERLVGQLGPAENAQALAFRPACLPPATPAWRVPLENVQLFEPAVREDGPREAAHAGTPHAVLLQDGSVFRAGFVKLDGDQVTLELEQQARLTLPRALLRKVDLYPEVPAPGAPIMTVAEGEKPGVQFLSKPGTDPTKEPAKELPRMDGAEILTADIATGELSVDPKDGGGAWTIDLRTARFLVFPPSPALPARPPPAWQVVLQQGTRFAVGVCAITPEKLEVELSGGKAAFPWAVVQTLQRAAK